MAIGKSEWILRDAVVAVVDGEVKDLEPYAMPEDYVPSLRFQDKLKNLNRRNKRRTFKRIGVKVACAVIVFLLLDFGHFIFTGSEAIASVLRLISEDQPGGFVGYEIKGDKPYVTTGMSIDYIPDGFVPYQEPFIKERVGDLAYINKNGNKKRMINVSYQDDPVTASNGIDNEHSTVEKGELEDGTPCEIRRCNVKGYCSFIIFARDNTLVQLSIDDYLEGWETTELLKVANSIKLQRRKKTEYELEQDRRTDEWIKEMEEQGIDPYGP